jgi:hypothetical protein
MEVRKKTPYTPYLLRPAWHPNSSKRKETQTFPASFHSLTSISPSSLWMFGRRSSAVSKTLPPWAATPRFQSAGSLEPRDLRTEIARSSEPEPQTHQEVVVGEAVEVEQAELERAVEVVDRERERVSPHRPLRGRHRLRAPPGFIVGVERVATVAAGDAALHVVILVAVLALRCHRARRLLGQVLDLTIRVAVAGHLVQIRTDARQLQNAAAVGLRGQARVHALPRLIQLARGHAELRGDLPPSKNHIK